MISVIYSTLYVIADFLIESFGHSYDRLGFLQYLWSLILGYLFGFLAALLYNGIANTYGGLVVKLRLFDEL